MALDSLELQLASAIQRFNTLQRRAGVHREPPLLLSRTLAELGDALEELRVVQEQLVESRNRIEQMQLEQRRQAEKYWQLFDEMPDAYVVSTPDSTILEVNRVAAELFNVSQRFLVGKTLSVFVCEDRSRFLTASAQAAGDGTTLEVVLRVRPRERAPLLVNARVSGTSAELRWIFRPAAQAGRDAAPL